MNGILRSMAGSLLLASFFVVSFSGCGPKTIMATGKVVQGGQPITIGEKGMMQLSFRPENAKPDTNPYPTKWEKNGTFTITGLDGKGIPAGKYRASLQIFDPYDGSGKDKFGNKYYGDKSPLVVEVGKGEIVLDVGK